MKVYIVDEVHMLTTEAFNALLKMLEEPPAHVIFILATTEPHKVLPTILSRCQRFDFRRPTLVEVTNVLKGVAAKEGIEVSENTLAVIARAAAGSFRDAIGTLDQLASYCESAISLQDALALLGVAEQDLLFELVDIVAEGNTKEALLFVERLAQNGADFNQFMRDMLGHLRDLYVMRHTEDAPAGLAATQERLESLRSQANRNATGELVHFIDCIGEGSVPCAREQTPPGAGVGAHPAHAAARRSITPRSYGAPREAGSGGNVGSPPAVNNRCGRRPRASGRLSRGAGGFHTRHPQRGNAGSRRGTEPVGGH